MVNTEQLVLICFQNELARQLYLTLLLMKEQITLYTKKVLPWQVVEGSDKMPKCRPCGLSVTIKLQAQ